MDSPRLRRLRHVPVFPLPKAVLYPGVTIPLYIFEERYKLMVNQALQEDRRLAISMLRQGEGGITTGRVCGLGEIVEVQELEDGEKNIMVRGVARIAIEEVNQEIPYIRAGARVLEETACAPSIRAARVLEIVRLSQQLVFLLDAGNAARLLNLLSFMEDPSFLTDFVAFYLLQEETLKQELLETLDVNARLRRVSDVLQGALAGIEG
jgi:Lon protease-like protein